jgi:hypothetical protein
MQLFQIYLVTKVLYVRNTKARQLRYNSPEPHFGLYSQPNHERTAPMRKLLGHLRGSGLIRPLLHAATLFLLLSPTIFYAQSCPTSITSITPGIWMAGKTYNYTIRGSGFADTGAAGCSFDNFFFTISFDTENTIPMNLNIVSDTKATATITLDASASTQTACFYAADYSVMPGVVRAPVRAATNASVASAATAEGITPSSCRASGGFPVQVLAAPTIQCDSGMPVCGGNVISAIEGTGTPPTTNAVIGQQIKLITKVDTAGIPITKRTWTAGPKGGPSNNVGGYTMTASKTKASTEITPTDLKTSDLTTYWLYPTGDNPVTYQYCVNIPGLSAADVKNGLNCSLPADATFNVVGPTATIVPKAKAWHVSNPVPMCTSTVKEQMLSFGTYNSTTSTTCEPVVITPGMTFDATVNLSPGNSGQAAWVQVLGPTNQTTGTGLGDQPIPSTNDVGLDNFLPYNDIPIPVDTTAIDTSDSPGTALNINWDIATRIFNAKMYLMWKSQIPGSIRVPLGYIQWSISGTATIQGFNNPVWTLTSFGPTSKQFHAGADDGTKNHGLPTFSHLVKNSTNAATNVDEISENEEEQQ